MNDMYDLREKLVGVFVGVQNGTLEIEKAKTLVSTAAQVVNTVKTQIKYHEVRGEKPNINFVGKAQGK